MTASTDARDLYGSIILRNNLRRLFRRDRESWIAKALAAAGESDNLIGGLFGKANFYGETTSPWLGQDRSAIDQVHDSMFVDTAEVQYLTALGNGNGVPRPPQAPYDDPLYQQLIQVLSWLPKTIASTSYFLAEVLFGDQNADGRTPWAFYEINANEIVFEIEGSLFAGSNSNASYLHGWAGHCVATGTNTITVDGTDASLAASSLAGLDAYVNIGGTWTHYTISSQSYSSGVNTIVLSGTVASGNYDFFIDIPSASSFSGDYMLSDASIEAGGTQPTSDQLVYLYGQGLLDTFEFYMNEFLRAAGVLLRVVIL